MTTYSGSKDSCIGATLITQLLIDWKREGLTRKEYPPNQQVYVPAQRGMPLSLGYVSDPDDVISEQRNEISNISEQLKDLGFDLKDFNEDHIEMERGGIEVSMSREEVKEDLWFVGIKNRKTAIALMLLGGGLFGYGTITPQYQEWEALKSELYYEIKVEDTEEEDLFVSGLDRRLKEQYDFE